MKLAAADVTALCDAAQIAWNCTSRQATGVRFVWRGRKYKSFLNTFRMCVVTEKGEPVAERWT